VGIGVFIWVAVRLSLSGPATFAERHIRVFESWILTRGVFWRLLGAYVLSLALVIVVMLLALVIYAAIAAVMLGGDLSQIGKVFQPDTSSLTSYFTPAMLIYLVFGAFLGALQNAVIYAPPAVAFRELHGPVED
jgi:glucan phosphoethanolaminetransferase (alkaline phosphatase superfamily)